MTAVALLMSGWLIFVAGVAAAALHFADKWLEEHAWQDVDG